MLLRTRRRRGGPTVRPRRRRPGRLVDGTGRYPGDVADATSRRRSLTGQPLLPQELSVKGTARAGGTSRELEAPALRPFVADQRATENDSE